jgi:pimeloyl-ACP methyl ester carboxylesterase
MKRVFRVLLSVLAAILGLTIILAVIIFFKSPGSPQPVKGSNNEPLPQSISTIEKVSLGDYEQYLIIRGADSTLPVMLFLHGGPGSPELPFRQMNPGLEKSFIMVYWEQRGACKSYSRNLPEKTMRLDQMISDTRELSEMLCTRFHKNKIYLLGHSWGSELGILTAFKYPELYQAYIGVGQVGNQYQGEKISFEWTKEQAAVLKDTKAAEKLDKLIFPLSNGDSEAWTDFLSVERKYVNKFGGGVARNIHSMAVPVKMVLNTREYTFRDKFNYMAGNLYSLRQLWPEVIDKDLTTIIDSMRIPVFIMQGKYDYQTPYVVAKQFYDHLKAPRKEFVTFENSAHSPIFEETDKFNSFLNETVLKIDQ